MNRSFGVTHPGMKRAENQDTFFCDDDAGVWLLADGMGGNRGGEKASAIAQEVLIEEIGKGCGIKDAILAGHQAILDYGNSHAELKGLGTTVVLAKESKRIARVAWVGDSRAYVWRQGSLSLVSKDHSIVQRLLDSGMISPQEAVNHPQRNLVTSILGLGLSNDSGLEIGMVDIEWRKGDKLLICSDGLTDELSDDQISGIMEAKVSTREQAEALLSAALEAGGRDNTTVLIIEAPQIKNIMQRIFSWFKA